jgi:hypothetical protein
MAPFDPMADPPQPRWTPDVFALPRGVRPIGYQPPDVLVKEGAPAPELSWAERAALQNPAIGPAIREAVADKRQEENQLADVARGSIDIPNQGMPERKPLSFEALMAGLPMRTGGGSSSVSTTNAVLSPQQGAEFRRRMEEATLGEQQAVRDKSAAQQALYRDLAANSREQVSGQAALLSAHQAKRAEMDAHINAQMADNARMLEDVKKTHIDPDRKDNGGFRQTIAMALGAIGAGLTRGPNLVQQLIEARADRDLKAQMADLQNKKFVYEAGRNMLTDLYRKTGDIERSYLLAKQAYTDMAKAQADALTRDAQSEEARAAGEQAVAQLTKAQVQNELQLKQLEYKRITTTRTSGPGQLTPAANLAMRAVIAERLKGAGIGGAGKQLPPKTSEALGAVGSALSGFKDFQRDYFEEKDKGAVGYAVKATLGGLWGSKVPAIEAQKDILASILRKATGEGGVMTDQDYLRYQKAMPKVTDHPSTARAKMAAVIKGLERDYAGQLSGLARGGYDVSGFAGKK